MPKKILREPSIHITESVLRKVLTKVWEDLDDSTYDILAKNIVIEARKSSLINRNILATTQKNRKVASKLVQSTLADARLFTKTLLQIRRERHHRGVTQIKEDSKDWLLIKQITELALAFTQDFEMDKQTGFKTYIRLAIERLKMFSLTRFPSLHEIICADYEAIEKISKDPHPVKTKEAANYYSSVIAKKTGESPDYTKIPEKYKYLVEIVDGAQDAGIDIKTYIDAQFHAFNWKQAVPELSQMVGEKAKERLSKYMYENNIQSNKLINPKKVIDFRKIIDPNANRD